ncbi:DUF6600 domain-containing protein [Legionella gresilensis]|uniref:DUF6600 domain-containing protein n=1 Tax=Legionella gresilensis TaxID=91823 RepID=UPI0010417C9D|nr:DUF6600 domain-containing protein [Legionella gresilensis]
MKRGPFLYFLFILIAMFITNITFADPPDRVARISFMDNVVSFLPAGANRWVKAKLNRPLIVGDSLWIDLDSKVELQLGLSALRQGPQTYMKILNLNSTVGQFKLTQGTLILSIRYIKPQQFYEIDTPNLAFVIRQPGYYRIDVTKQATTVTVRKGSAIVYGRKNAYKMTLGRICKFWGTNLGRFQCAAIGPTDSFDKWSLARDQRLIEVKTYVSTSMIGYEDLTYYGKWIVTKKYGRAWVPNRISSDWVPYRVGQWTWVRSWGWTWVDDQPWGFAPFHYGRWAFAERRWIWVPGPANIEPIYAPALVAFVGGRNYPLNLAAGRRGIAWFPLGPGDVYIPPYPVSQAYFTQLNLGNTYINQNYLTTIYNNPNTVINYQNININNGITAVPVQAFVSSRPVSQALVDVPAAQIMQAPKTPIAAIAPESESLLGSADAKTAQPASAIENQPAVAITPPPAPPAPFTQEQKLLNKDPGKPLATEDLQNLQPAKEATPQIDNSEINVIKPEEKPKLINEDNMKSEDGDIKDDKTDVQQKDNIVQPAEVTDKPAQQPEEVPTPTDVKPTEQPDTVTQPEVITAPDSQQPGDIKSQDSIQEQESQPVVTEPTEQAPAQTEEAGSTGGDVVDPNIERNNTAPSTEETIQPEEIHQPQEVIQPGVSQDNANPAEESIQPEQVTQPQVNQMDTTAPVETTTTPEATQPGFVEPQGVINQPGSVQTNPAAPGEMTIQPDMPIENQPTEITTPTNSMPGEPQQIQQQEVIQPAQPVDNLQMPVTTPPETTIQPGTIMEPGVPQPQQAPPP